MDQLNNLDLTSAIKYIAGGLYASFGGFTHYIYQKSLDGGRGFSIFMLFSNAFVSFFVGQVMWDFIPVNSPYRGGLTTLAGFLAYPMLQYLEKNGVKLFVDGFKRAFNIN